MEKWYISSVNDELSYSNINSRGRRNAKLEIEYPAILKLISK